MSTVELAPPDEQNVRFYNGLSGVKLGGLYQNGSLTQAKFFDLLSIFLVTVPIRPDAQRTLVVQNRLGGIIEPTYQQLIPGEYNIFADGEPWLSEEELERKGLAGLFWSDPIIVDTVFVSDV
ncbi:uncharacterized protein N7484_002211 [Penicillium longicatenatum]|uniref:uncharacterized protein n=1 Tax=Penicillium longicatenatum TaxID=1561947 RepID=UPI002547DBB2|nr:uncharacterized protein N7484_002211 [Penicillium longicatenatum]KAJ5658562.1 hypothetical protein N7484_002211 [Penicillium longicatenatum]